MGETAVHVYDIVGRNKTDLLEAYVRTHFVKWLHFTNGSRSDFYQWMQEQPT